MEKVKTIIRPPSRLSLNFSELWQYRELFYFFTWRDVKVKYKETYLGVLWALLQPLGLMLLFTLIFSQTLRTGTDPLPYPVFVLSGLVLWNLFYSAVSQAGESMIQHAHIIKKIYFPRLIIPASALLVALFDFAMAFIVFVVLVLGYGLTFHLVALLYLPAALLLLLTAAFGLGALLAALNLKFRDFRYALPFLLQVLFFASGVIYPVQAVGARSLQYVLALNPVNGAIELLRASLTGVPPDTMLVLLGCLSSILLTFTGLTYFRRTESYFADIA